MAFTREELDWIEAEWAYHLHGRQAFLSREDFLQIRGWEGQGVPAEAVVAAMEAYFARRVKRARSKGFTTLAHVEKDVQKAMTYRKALDRAESMPVLNTGWDRVKEPLRADPKAKAAFDAWCRAKTTLPSPDSPGFLDAFDEERKAFRLLMEWAAQALGSSIQDVEVQVKNRLSDSKLQPGTRVFDRAWSLHRARLVCEVWGIPVDT